jgi:lysophospholipase L1-like esterase
MNQNSNHSTLLIKSRPLLNAIASRAALVLLGLIFGLVILEIGFRIAYPDPSPRLVNQGIQFHETLGHAFRPNAEGWNTSLRGEYSAYVKINSKGLRDREYSYHKGADAFRILVLGDSFTVGLQLPEAETFPKLLEAQLNRYNPQTKFEVINAGVIGYSTDKQLAYFSQEGYKYQPDLVILAFFIGNDLTDNIWHALYRLEHGQLVPNPPLRQEARFTPVWAKEGTAFRNVRNFLYRNSRLYSVSIELLTLSTVQKIPGLTQFLISMGLIEITQPVINYGNIYAFRYLPDIAWETTKALILQLKQEVESRDSQLLVLILPDETDIDARRRQEILETYAYLIKQETLQAPPPTRRLADILDRADIAYLQLLPALQTSFQESQTPLYYPYDGHWTPAGHRVAAQAIYDYLIKNPDKLNKFPLVATQGSATQK